MDAVYSDATWRDGVAGIGVVLIRDGVIVERTSTLACVSGSVEAELSAARLATFLYPDAVLHVDCQPVADEMGAVWVPRDKNREAHRAAKAGLKKTRGRTPKQKKKFRFRGRGVVSLEEKRLQFN